MSATAQAASWPYWRGEMAACIRIHPWAATPLGPVEGWPEALRAIVELMLASPLVSTLVVGPARMFLYNDPAARLYGDRHPEALGRPLPETWPEAYAVVAPFYERAFAGEAVQVPAQPLNVSEAGGEVFEATLTPVRDASGAVLAVHMTGFEVSARLRAEAALQDSEARYRAFVTATADVVYRMSPDWSELRELDGRGLLANTPEPSGIWMERYIEPEDWATMRAAIGEAIRSRTPFELEHRVRRADGTLGWTLSRAVPVLNRQGEVAEWIGAARDVTERRRTQAELAASEERLRQFGEASSDVLWVRDATTLEWTYLTPAFEAIYGLNREEALAGDSYRNWLKLILPEDRDHVAQEIGRVQQGERATFEYRVRRPSDGEVRWVRNTDFPIRNASGTVEHIGGVGHDVTDMKRAQEVIARSEAALQLTATRLTSLTEGIPQLVWRAVDHGHWTWASPQWTAFTGQPEAESRGWGWLDMLHPDDRDGAREAWERSKLTGEFHADYRLRMAATGEHRWFQTRAMPVYDDVGALVEWLGTSTDVQDLHDLYDRQSVLVAELQHRTRNLMGVVRAILDTTLRQSPEPARFLPAFRGRIEALARVNGLLSRLYEGDRVTFDELLRAELGAMGAVTVRGQGERVTLDGPRGVRLRSSTVQAFALALHELATNALKYGALNQDHPDGHLTVRWQVLRGEASGAHSEAGGPRLHAEWTERGVTMPELGAPAQEGGYGRELIEQALPYQLGAQTTYEMAEDGVRCTITLPLSATTGTLDA